MIANLKQQHSQRIYLTKPNAIRGHQNGSRGKTSNKKTINDNDTPIQLLSTARNFSFSLFSLWEVHECVTFIIDSIYSFIVQSRKLVKIALWFDGCFSHVSVTVEKIKRFFWNSVDIIACAKQCHDFIWIRYSAAN